MKFLARIRGTIPPSRGLFAFFVTALLLYGMMQLARTTEGIFQTIAFAFSFLLLLMLVLLVLRFAKDKPKASASIELGPRSVLMQVSGELDPTEVARIAGKAWAFTAQDPKCIVPRASGTVREGPNNELIAVRETETEIEKRYQDDVARVTALQSQVSEMLVQLAQRKPMLSATNT